MHDLAAFTFPRGPVEIDQALLDRFPSEYAPLAYLLTKLKQEGARWLHAKE